MMRGASSRSPRGSRWRVGRGIAWLAAGLLAVTVTGVAAADDVTLPPAKQIELLAKVADYDRNFRDRAGARAQILLLVKPGDGDSVRTAAQMQAALEHVDAVGGLPHDDRVESYPGAAALADEIRSQHIAVVIIGPGFRGDVEAIRAALEGVDVLSVSAVPDFVPKGIVLGFDLVGGHPKMLVQLTQARKQHVAFVADVLKLMQVFE
jgi:YfiR/HmsC-like